jgi:phage terminase small subunit
MAITYKTTRKLNFDKLSDKGKELCSQIVASGLGPREAAIEAGYSELWANKNSYSYVTKPTVRAYIEHLKNKQINRTGVDPDFVVKRLIRLADSAEGEGKYNEAIRAMELLGKHYQMFQSVSKQEIEVTNKNPFTTGESDVAKRAALHRLTKVTGLLHERGGDPDEADQAQEDTPDGEAIH